MKTLKDFRLERKRILLRCDFDVPLLEQGLISDDFRIRKTLPTIEYLIESRAKVILISHLDRPQKEIQNAKFKTQNENLKLKIKLKYSLKPIALRLEKLLRKEVKFLEDCLGERIEKEIEKMKAGEVLLLENLRFYKEEKENDQSFAKALAKLAEIYINEAFAVCHRSHASIVGIPKYLPSGMGFLLEKEIKTLTNLMENPERPLISIIGGKKVETKTKLIDKISEKADFVLIGGLINKEIEERNIKLKFPEKIEKPLDLLKRNDQIFDIGEKTIALFKEKIKGAKTIFWSGPLGYIEEKEFQRGTREITKAIIDSQAFSVAGGGDTVKFINKIGLAEKFNHLSTGGGAMLAFLSGEKLPGLKALEGATLITN